MINTTEALQLVLSNFPELGTETIFTKDACERTLMLPVFSNSDLPPYHRVAMDGIAVSIHENWGAQLLWNSEGIQFAGQAPLHLKNTNHCIEVMTGAPLPIGTNTVIRYEDLDENPQGFFSLHANTKIRRGQNIHHRASDKKKGDILLHFPQVLSPVDLATIASAGITEIKVRCKPRAFILNTGTELYDIHETPPPYGIRASNGQLLVAALAKYGVKSNCAIIRDDYDALESTLKEILAANELIIITGAVSKGKADFIPELLEKLGASKIFHGVAQRPGKPFWFGKKNNTIIFAMPGNPVSVTACTYVYLLPWLKQLMRNENTLMPTAILLEDVEFKPSLTYFMQVKINNAPDGQRYALPQKGNGSGDFSNLSAVDAFMILPAERSFFNKGEKFPIISIR